MSDSNKKHVCDFNLPIHKRKPGDCAVIQGISSKKWYAEIWENSVGYSIFSEGQIVEIPNKYKYHDNPRWRLKYEYTDVRPDQIDLVYNVLIRDAQLLYGPILFINHNDFERPEEQENFTEDESIRVSVPTPTVQKSKSTIKTKTVTPTMRLIRRIKKEFDKKLLLGDIVIDDDEYKLILDYCKSKMSCLTKSSSSEIDPVFCVTMVQIGIRKYDGRYWPHVKDAFDLDRLPGNIQHNFGEVFNRTIKSKNKLLISENEYVNSILVHSFVTDYYSGNFFSFLFAFYNIDLERDLSRLDSQTMNNLIDVMMRNDNTGRTYFLVEQTADAVRNCTKGSKLRIRRFIKLIDKAFWGEPLPLKSNNRLTQRFLNWLEESKDFVGEKSQYGSTGRRKKSFSIPHLKYDPRNETFKLVLPPQIIKYDNSESDNYYWKISVDGNVKELEIDLYDEGVTGFKTGRQEILLPKEFLFSSIAFEIMHDNDTVRRFKIASEIIRFFDNEGNYIKGDSLTKGMAISFTKNSLNPQSSSVLYSDNFAELVRTYYDFVDDDIVILSDGTTFSVGKKIKEGLLSRDVVKHVKAEENSAKDIPVYSSFPQILIRMLPQRAPGTAVYINKTPHKLYSGDSLSGGFSRLEIKDPSGECGFLFNPQYFGYSENGIYEISVDIPNDHAIRAWKFLLIQDFSFYFDDEPYIFKSKGTICYPKEYALTPADRNSKVDTTDENRYDFEIIAGKPTLEFYYGEIKLLFDIPALSYRFEGEEWQVNPHVDVWHSDFISKLYIDYPRDRITISLDEDLDDITDSDQSETFEKIKSRNLFECDLNRFKSWFGHSKMMRTLYLNLPEVNSPIEFLKVATRSYLSSVVLSGDFNNGLLIGRFDIVGKANYYADIILDGNLLAEKVEIVDGSFKIPSELKSGTYTINVFESNEDDSGFGDFEYIEIGNSTAEITNPKDLTGKSIVINSIVPSLDQTVYLPLSFEYKVIDLRKQTDIGTNFYTGKMVVIDHFSMQYIATFEVCVEFADLNNLRDTYITFIDEEDNIEFLYDAVQKKIVKQENDYFSSHEAYRRYKPCLYPEDYTYKISFISASQLEKTVVVDDDDYNNLISKKRNNSIFKSQDTNKQKKKAAPVRFGDKTPQFNNPSIEAMALSKPVYIALNRIGLRTAHDIFDYDSKRGLLKAANINVIAVKELGEKLRRIGIMLPSYELFNVNEEQEALENEIITPTVSIENLDDINSATNIHVRAKEFDRLSDTSLKRYIWSTLNSSGILTVGDLIDFVKTNGMDSLLSLQYFSEGKLKGVKKFLESNNLL